MTTTETRSLVIEREMPYPPEKIWRALTQGSLIKEWLMDNDFQPEGWQQVQLSLHTRGQLEWRNRE